MWSGLFYTLGVLSTVCALLTTPPPSLEQLEARRHALFKRTSIPCDGDHNAFFCPLVSGTCFTNPADGYIGCCSVSYCNPRTNCINYNPTITSPCDSNTGGCIYCSQSATPYCFEVSNVVASQYIVYCNTIPGSATVSYTNPNSGGSQWYARTPTASPASSSSSTLPSSTSTPSTSSSASTSSPSSITGAATSTATSGSGVQPQGVTTTSGNASLTTGSGSSAIGGGAIGGIAAGAVVGVAAFALGLWFLLKKKRQPHPPYSPVTTMEKYESPDSSAPSGTREDPAEAEGSTPQMSAKMSSGVYSPEHIARRFEADGQAVSEVAGSLPAAGLGITKATDRSSAGSKPTSGNLDQASKRHSYLVSPVLTSDGSIPGTPSITKTPPTPQHASETTHSPSIYTRDPPGSVSRPSSMNPPSLPQPYSAASMSSQSAPWAYLSAEDAMSGGWVNPPDKKG